MSAPPDLTSTTFVDGETVNSAKLYARVFTVINYLLGVANVQTQTRFFASLLGGPSVPSGANIPLASWIVEDTASGWNSSSNYWVCPSLGTYLILMQQIVGNAVTTNGFIMKNGANYAIAGANNSSVNFGQCIAVYARLAIGDTIAFRTTVTFTSDNQSPMHATYFQILQLSYV